MYSQEVSGSTMVLGTVEYYAVINRVEFSVLVQESLQYVKEKQGRYRQCYNYAPLYKRRE